MLLILFLTTVLPGSIHGFETVFGDEVSADLCKLPDGVFSDPDSCTTYIRCQSGEPEVEFCSDGLLFNPIRRTCDFSKTGNCSDSNDFSMTSGMVQTNDVACSQDGPNIYPIQSSCSEYYMCDNDVAYKVKCPAKLLMNDKKLTCDYSENVECDDISSTEESTVDIKAIYENEEESKAETSVTIENSSQRTETDIPRKEETYFDSEEISGDSSLNNEDRNLYMTLDITENTKSDSSIMIENERSSNTLSVNEMVTTKMPISETPVQTKKITAEISSESAATTSDETVKESLVSTPDTVNVTNDRLISSSSSLNTDKENKYFESLTTDDVLVSDIKTSSDVVATDLISDFFDDYSSGEGLEESDTGSDEIENFDNDMNVGSISDTDATINIFENDSTNDISSNTPSVTFFNEYELSTKITSTVDETMTSMYPLATSENKSTLDFDFSTYPKDKLSQDVTTIPYEKTKSEISLSSSQKMISEDNLTDDMTNIDNLTSTVKTTESMERSSNLNNSSITSVLTTQTSTDDIENENYFQVTTTRVNTTIKETDSNITPGRTLTTSQALMSSDPLTDNETTKFTTSETSEITPKYMIDTSIDVLTERYPSPGTENSEMNSSTSLLNDLTKNYETASTELINEHSTQTSIFEIPSETSTVRIDDFSSSKYEAQSTTSESSKEIKDLSSIGTSTENAEMNGSTSISNDLIKTHETSSTELIAEYSTQTSIFEILSETSTVRIDDFSSSKSTTSEISKEMKNFPSIETTSDELDSFSNDFITSSPSQQKSPSESSFITKSTSNAFNLETEAFPGYIASELSTDNGTDRKTINFISTDEPTESDVLTKTATNEDSGMSSSLNKIEDSYFSGDAEIDTNLDTEETSVLYLKDQFRTNTPTEFHYGNEEDFTTQSRSSVTSSHTSPQVIDNNELVSETQEQTITESTLKLIPERNMTAVDYFTEANFQPTEKSPDITDATPEHTEKNLVISPTFSEFEESSSDDVVFRKSSLNSQHPEKVTEGNVFSSENGVTNMNLTYTDLLNTNNYISDSTNSFIFTTETLIPTAEDFEDLYDSSSTYLMSSSVADSVSSLSQTSLNIYTDDLQSNSKLQNESEIENATKNEKFSTSDYFTSLGNTDSLVEETKVLNEARDSASVETSLNLSSTDEVNDILDVSISSSFNRITSVPSTVELATERSVSERTDSMLEISDPNYVTEHIEERINQTNPSIHMLNNTIKDLIDTDSSEITESTLKSSLPSKLSSIENIDSTLNTASFLSKTTDIFEAISESDESENLTSPEATLKLFEVTEDSKDKSTDSNILRTTSLESSNERNKISETSEVFSEIYEFSTSDKSTARISSNLDVNTDVYVTAQDVIQTTIADDNKLITDSISDFQTDITQPGEIFLNSIHTSTESTAIKSDHVNVKSTTDSRTLISEDKLETEPSTFNEESLASLYTENVFETTATEDFGTSKNEASDNSNSKTDVTFKPIADISPTSEKTIFSNIYEESESTNLSENSVITVSSVLQNTNRTSEPFWPKSESTTFDNSNRSILEINTTIFYLTSLKTVPSTVAEETSTFNYEGTNLIDDTSYTSIFTSEDSFSDDSFVSSLNIQSTSKQNEINFSLPLQTVSSELFSNFRNVTDSTSSFTDISPKSTEVETSNNLESESNDIMNSTLLFTITDFGFLSENQTTNPTDDIGDFNSKTETIPVNSTTETFTKLNSAAFETSKVTDHKLEDSTLNTQTSFYVASKTTLNNEWPGKLNTKIQTVTSDSIDPDEQTTNFSTFSPSFDRTFKTSNNEISTQTALYDETFEFEERTENKTYSSSDHLILTNALAESTLNSLNSTNLTPEIDNTTSNMVNENFQSTTDGSFSSTLQSSEFNSSSISTTSISELTASVSNFERETDYSTKIETKSNLSVIDETLSTTDSKPKGEPTTAFTNKISTEIPKRTTKHIPLTETSGILVTETENNFWTSTTTDSITKVDNLVDDRLETTFKFTNSIVSITSQTLPEDSRKSEHTFLPTDFSVTESSTINTKSSSKDISESDLQTLSTATETAIFSINDISEANTQSMSTDYSTDSNATRSSKDISESDLQTISISSEAAILSMNDTTETNSQFRGTDYLIDSIAGESSTDISESDLPTISTASEAAILSIKDTTKMDTQPINTDYSTVSISRSSKDISESDLQTISIATETAISSIKDTTKMDTQPINTDYSTVSIPSRSSKDISESDLQTISIATETAISSIKDATETDTQSLNTDYSTIAIASRNFDESTEKFTDPSSTYFPAALRTKTSQSTLNTITENHYLRKSSTDVPSDSTTTANPICETSEGKFPYKGDCNKFYQCKKGISVVSLCVGDEHFDPVKKICANPCLAKCDPNADCGTTESTTSEAELGSQTLTEENFFSTSQSYASETEETNYTTPSEYSTDDTTPDKISKWDFEETSTITDAFVSHSSTLESTFGGYSTVSLTSDEQPISIVDINATEESTDTVSEVYMNSTYVDKVTMTTYTDVPSTSTIEATTTAPYESTPKEKTKIIEETPSTVISSTDKKYETSSAVTEFTLDVSTTSFSKDEDDSSNTVASLIIPIKCEDEDCLSSKSPTSATVVPSKLCDRNDFVSQSNCDEYLDCTGKVPNKLECPVGLYFNPTTRVCDWPYSANCGKLPEPLYEPTDIKCPCRTCLIPSTTSCSHYYLCLGFTAYELKCSNNLYFDRIWNTCNYAPLVDCVVVTTSSSTVKIEPTESSTKISTTKISSTKTPTTPKSSSFVCPSREGFFRYPGDCGMYYQCGNWFPFMMQCPATTHFSEITKRCEFPCDAKCDSTLNCGSSSTASPSDPRCSCLNCKLPSPESCTKYIICTKGRGRIEYCPWGQTFDVKRSTCDWAHKVACRHSTMCPERNGQFSHKDDCHKFVHCSNGIPNIKKCPSVLEFDPVKKRCEWPTGRCSDLPIPKELNIFKQEEHRKGWRCPKTFGYFSNDQHCNKFYQCSFGTPSLKECSPGLLYNPRYQTCDWKKHVRCQSNRHQKPRKCRVFDHHVVCSEDRIPRPHTLCNMYYDCTAGRACGKQCPVGLYFNNITGVCDLPENVRCFNPGKEDYSLKELSLKCASGADGRQVNPTDPGCFYHCRQGKVVTGCCSKGHVYNLHKDKCERRTKSLRI